MSRFSARPANGHSISKVLMVTALFLTVTSAIAAKPDEVSETAVKDCQFMGKVEGSSGYGKNWGWQPLAKSHTLQRAEQLGATHVVWQQFIPVGAFNGVAVARAYDCR